MKKLAIAVTTVAALTGSAIAADMPMKSPVAPVVRATSWTGCYVGAGGGYGMWNQDNQTYLAATGLALDLEHTDGGRGWFGTGQVGCDYQFSPKWLVGAFADADFGASMKGTMTTPAAILTGDEKLLWSWAAGARIGYLPWDTLLTYVSAGFTQARFSQVDLSTAGGTLTDYIAQTTYSGYFLGSGYEYKLDWLPGLMWKTEYRFADYGSKDNNILTLAGAPTTDSVHSHKYVQTVRTELVYRFNMH